jgi:hypothetical protein
MIDTNDLPPAAADPHEPLPAKVLTFTHPDEVLQDRSLAAADKRAILAAWASDAHAVPDLPAMRQLHSGAIVGVDVVLAALRSLDGPEARVPQDARPSWSRPRLPVRMRRTRFWRRPNRNDDDDPPPTPVGALPPLFELRLRDRQRAWQAAAA